MLDSTPDPAAWRCAGLDVSLGHVDFFFSTATAVFSGRLPRQAEPLGALARQLREAGAELVILEATGGLETLPWSVLEQAGLAVAVVNPRRVRHFARSLGVQAKTDRLDAVLLAHFGERLRPAPTPFPDAHRRGFQQLLRHLAEVVDQRARWRTTLHRAEEPACASLQRLITAIGAEIRLLEQQLEKAARSVRRYLERSPRRPRCRGLLRSPLGCRQAPQSDQHRRRQKTPRRAQLHASTSLRLASRTCPLTQSLDTGWYT